MKKAIEIIRDAYAYVGLCPTGMPLDANMSREGLEFLNELLYKWNLDNYFPFTQNTIEGHVGSEDDGIVTIAPDGNVNGEKPLVLVRMLLKFSQGYEELRRVSYENIFTLRGTCSTPTAYAFSHDSEGRGKVFFDGTGSFDFLCIYNKALPTMDYNDELHAPPQYAQALKYGIAHKCGIRYGVAADSLAMVKQELDNVLAAIKKTNNFKREVNINTGRRSCQSPFDRVMRGW